LVIVPLPREILRAEWRSWLRYWLIKL